MDKTFRDILDLICGDTGFVTAILFVVGFVFALTLLCEPSWDVTLGLLAIGVSTAVFEFRSENSKRTGS